MLGSLPIAQRARARLEGLGHYALLVRETWRSLTRHPWERGAFSQQLHRIGVQSQPVVLVTGAFTGMVLCAQTLYQFHKVKMDTATLAVVSVSMASELGPVLTGLMVAGRVGAAMAAELGTMKVTEQIDALRALATHPVDYLVAPRLLAALVAMPVLTSESIAIGILAGYATGVGLLGMDPAYSWHNMVRYTHPADVLNGLIKSVFFGGLVATIGCHKGLQCLQGAEGVGKATTEAVVAASIAILISNFFLTLTLNRILG
ncbi:MAG: ABC transporter permease [Verrucomicrobia bacterium]|nr:ABC transporter permease [Verrucomicrobiota bacterium]